MTIATKNGVPIIQGGKIVTDCSCCGGLCVQVAVRIPGFIDGEVLTRDWPGITVEISGRVTYYGNYFGAVNGFWQGAFASMTSPSSVRLSFNQEKPAKIIVICTAMNTGENQSYDVVGSAKSAVVSNVTPPSAYTAGNYGVPSGTIERADPPGFGDSRFNLTIEELFEGSISGFVWSHATQENVNGMVNSIFLCRRLADTI